MAKRKLTMHHSLPGYFVYEKVKGGWVEVFMLTDNQEPIVDLLGLDESYDADMLTQESINEMVQFA